MEVAITGASGLVGRALVASLQEDGHRVRRLVRSPGDATDDRDAVYWSPAEGVLEPVHLKGVDAVVHLGGAGIADRRWSENHKREILQSRTRGTELLSRTLAKLDDPPKVLVSASGAHYYGDTGDQICTEASPAGSGFLADVVASWEAATSPAEAAGIRVAHCRNGVILSRTGGMLAKMLLPFRLGLGGRVGSGEQWMSWITLTDEVRAIRYVLDAEDVSGPVNLTSPQPVTNQVFTQALGRALHRPTFMPTPVFALKLVMGRELVDELMLMNLRVRPAKLEDAGFTFDHADIDSGLKAVLQK